MEFKRQGHLNSNHISFKYPHDLQIYDSTPTSNVLLHEFEEMALERLKALKAIETVSLRGFTKLSQEWKKNFSEELVKQELRHLSLLYSSGGDAELKNWELRRRDHISHFILCLAFCRTDELRNWFMNKEIELFQVRFDALSPRGLQNFLNIKNLEFKPIAEEDKTARSLKLSETFQNLQKTEIEQMNFYKIPFRKVLDLVRGRRVLLEKGFCYVAASDLGNVLASKLRQEIAHSLAVLRQSLPETTEDRRLDAVLKCLLEHYEAGSYRPSDTSTDTLRMEDLDELSKRSFPPCMRRLHEALRTKHHLRHEGRQQYQLFLKGAGLPLEESMRFWRTEFMKIMTIEKFEKDHAYNIRHNYGQEGNRRNYSPCGCNKIIHMQPGPEDFNGCPFRHSKPQELRRLLLSYRISNNALTEVMEYQEKQLYTLACQKLLLVTHPEKGVEFGLCHPNQYFSESRQLISGVKQEKTAVSTPSESNNSPASAPASSNATPQNTPASQSTPTSSTLSARATPASSRRALPIGTAPKQVAINDSNASNNIADWLDEADDDMLQQMEAMETQ